MGHQGLPTVPCPCPTSHLPTGAAQITISISISLPGLILLHVPHKLISAHPHHPLLANPKCVHLPHVSPLPGTTPTAPHPCPSSCILKVHPSPAPAPSGLETPQLQGWGQTSGRCPRTYRWGSSPPSRSHPLQLCSHWPRSAPGSSGGTGGPLSHLLHQPCLTGHCSWDAPAQCSLLLPSWPCLGQQRGYGMRAMGCLGASHTLEVRSRWKMPLECR